MARKRKSSQSQSKTKRSKMRAASPPQDVEDAADPEFQELLALIEDHERLAKQLEQPEQSGPNHLSGVIELDDSNGDPELQELLAQIKAQEESERLAKQLQEEVDKFSASTKYNGTTTKPIQQAPRKHATPPLVQPDQSLRPFRDLFTASRECTNCGKQVKSPRGWVVFSQSAIPPSLASLLHAPCKSCHTNHCRGCFSPVTCPTSCKGSHKNSNCKILECCAEGRAIAIFEALGGFDQQYIVEQSASRSRSATIAKNAQKGSSVGPGGTGYGMDSWAHNAQQSANKAPTPAASTWERTILHSVKVLVDLLPAPYSDDPKAFDVLPHPSIGHLISLSQLPVVLGSLLRNDSVTDWISRKEMYNAMLALLRRMGDCELTIWCLIGQRCEAVTSCGIQEWMWQTGDIVWRRDSSGKLEISPPLYTYLKKITKQSESFLAGAMGLLGEEQDVEETIIEGASLCGDIIAARDDLERVISVLGEPSSSPPAIPEPQVKRSSSRINKSRKGKGRELAIEFDNGYAEACERLAFKYVSLGDDGSYRFNQDLKQTQTSTRLPQNRLHLLQELVMTSTSLPPGIWVRVDEVRNDVIKIMIAGPDGTPYAGGLFEFDCFLPLDYPNRSPCMHLRTTGGGTVRFNPNLYACGKVCLSLLGTWSGRPEEQWHPGKSTILQVLISIQSMILNELPYYNEPGFGQANPTNPASIAYNKDIYGKTVKWAIVDWLREDRRSGIWRDIIASHFKMNKDKIRARIVEWSKANGPYPNSGDLSEQFDNGMRIIESWEDIDSAS